MKKRKRRKLKVFRILLVLLIFSIIVMVSIIGAIKFKEYKKLEEEKKIAYNLEQQRIKKEKEFQSKWKQVFKEDDKEYPIIKIDNSDSYLGEGQKLYKESDEYFTTFTTYGDNKKTYIEYKQNGATPWKDNPYWDATMEESGCGITMMSILLSGYGFNYTPEDLRNKYYPNLNYANLDIELRNSYNIKSSKFYFDPIYFSKNKIISHLKSDRPIILCVWSKVDNRWTTKSHYILLLGVDSNNMVYVSNPNGLYNSSKSSGWYEIEEIIPYIAKVMYIESYK